MVPPTIPTTTKVNNLQPPLALTNHTNSNSNSISCSQPIHKPCHNRQCYPADQFPVDQYNKWGSPYSAPDTYHKKFHQLIQFTKSLLPTKLNSKWDPGKLNLKAQTFYHHSSRHMYKYQVGLKPLADLGPDIEDYYQLSQYRMTTQEMEVKCTGNS